jgi:outer membrane protein assembly factor BamB
VNGGLCLFGSRDGWAYCLNAKDGKLVWRFRATPQERRIVAFGQLESARPLVGGVLVYDGLAYFVLGRHSASDGGLLVQAVEPKTGKLVWSELIEGHNGVPDVLTAGGGTIQMAAWEVDAKTGKPRTAGQGRLRGGHLGLLNDAWYKRPIAIRRNLSLWSSGDRPTGQMLAFNETTTCGYRACHKVNTGNGEMSGNALLFAKPSSGKEWSVKMPTTSRLRGMVLAGERLYVAGLLHKDEKDKDVASRVRMYNVAEGKLLAEYVVDDRLVHDCLAVADGRLYISTEEGKLICLGSQ